MSVVLSCKDREELEVSKEFLRQSTLYNNMVEDTGEDPDRLTVKSFSIGEIKFIYDLFQTLNTATVENIPPFEYIDIDNMENNFSINYVNKRTAPPYTGDLVGAYKSFFSKEQLFDRLNDFMMFADTIRKALYICEYIYAVENNLLDNFHRKIHEEIKTGKIL